MIKINEDVAKMLGWTKLEKGFGIPPKEVQIKRQVHLNYVDAIPDYCHSISAAWEIVEKLVKKYFVTIEIEKGPMGRTIVKIWKNNHNTSYGWVIDDIYNSTTPMAICKAFLKLCER